MQTIRRGRSSKGGIVRCSRKYFYVVPSRDSRREKSKGK